MFCGKLIFFRLVENNYVVLFEETGFRILKSSLSLLPPCIGNMRIVQFGHKPLVAIP